MRKEARRRVTKRNTAQGPFLDKSVQKQQIKQPLEKLYLRMRNGSALGWGSLIPYSLIIWTGKDAFSNVQSAIKMNFPFNFDVKMQRAP